MKRFLRRVLCRLGVHRWEKHQEMFDAAMTGSTVVVAWDQCSCCAKSRLVHILK